MKLNNNKWIIQIKQDKKLNKKNKNKKKENQIMTMLLIEEQEDRLQ